MRSEENFVKVLNEMKWFVNFHKKPVWIVALDDGYTLTVIKPEAHELPAGTAANLYDVDHKIIDEVVSSKTSF